MADPDLCGQCGNRLPSGQVCGQCQAAPESLEEILRASQGITPDMSGAVRANGRDARHVAASLDRYRPVHRRGDVRTGPHHRRHIGRRAPVPGLVPDVRNIPFAGEGLAHPVQDVLGRDLPVHVCEQGQQEAGFPVAPVAGDVHTR